MDPGLSHNVEDITERSVLQNSSSKDEAQNKETGEPPLKMRRKFGAMRAQLDKCSHKVIVRKMCADCGIDIDNLRRFFY